MQVMCIEFAREVYESDEPNSTEFDQRTDIPIIDLMYEQRGIVNMGGTMRLGLYPCQLAPNSKAEAAYKSAGASEGLSERHRHRYEFHNRYRREMEAHGMVFSGISPDNMLVEIAELKDHPFMLATQFHPEFKSRPTAPHPLFVAFVKASVEHQNQS